jgi:hypothetical protein
MATLISNSDKDTISTSVTIVGLWHILKDSFYVVDAPPFYNPGDSIYSGVATDYYDFKSDGSLYRKVGNIADTLGYEILPNNQIDFVYNKYIMLYDSLVKLKETYTITTLIQTNLTISTNISSDILGPEGYFANRLKLTK